MSLFRVDPKHPFVGPHQGQLVSKGGPSPQDADGGMVLVHGRGGSAHSMLLLAKEFPDNNLALRAPHAFRNSWYPYSFQAPVEDNEPGISSGLQAIYEVMKNLRDTGIPRKKIILLGFSQGACLVLEYAARHPFRYGGIAGLSGGLIGSSVEADQYRGSLEGAPVFLGCSDDDPHIPIERVEKTSQILESLGGRVQKNIYPGMGHTVNEDEIERVTDLISNLS